MVSKTQTARRPGAPARAACCAVLAAAFAAPAAAAAGGQPPRFPDDDASIPVVREQPWRAPEGLQLRVRLTAITPAEPTVIRWRYGGEGLGGQVVRGRFPKAGADPNAADEAHQLEIGEWSAPIDVAALAPRFPEKLFLTITAGRPGRVIDRVTREKGDYSTGAVFELEFRYRGRVVKRLREKGPDGGTVTIVVPAWRLTGQATPASDAFLHDLVGVLEYARRRAAMLERLPWADGPLPRKYAIVNNAGGYGRGAGYGIRTTDPDVTRAELRSLRQLGVNGFRDPPELLRDMLAAGGAEAEPWRRAMILHIMGFPTPRWRGRSGDDPQAGCPFGDRVAAETERLVAESLRTALAQPVDEVWGLTVDEIGAVIDLSREKKGHLAVCPRCGDAFRRWLAGKGLQPRDFGAADWSAVRPLDVWDPESSRPWRHDPGLALAAYYTRDFNNYVTAKLFAPLREALAERNELKRRAAAGQAAANQPWVYSYALRGNTFLMKGHSLDFFDFYRLADNAIVYETSNRGARIWGWDSYLCDVQRVVGQRFGLAQGIYIKPHRGAPIQRMLSAVSRGDTMIYWYTYGPDYKKGDSFSQYPEALRLTSKAAHLLGKAEDALYGARWARPAEVAIVKPETTQRWMNLEGNPPHLMAAWENAKWVYSALQHAHIPVDPIDERMLAEDDLSRYKLICVNGSHITRAAAEGLARYVRGGGVLWTSGWGLARDEANQPLELLHDVLGLASRGQPEMYYEVSLYGAGTIEPYDDPRRRLAAPPAGAALRAGELVERPFTPVVGRERLQPAAGAEVLARFADGAAAAVRHSYGAGQAVTVGLFPGLEYSAAVRRPDFDMRRDFDPALRRLVAAPALRRVRPVVDASDPLVEGVLLENPASGIRAVTLANWAYRVVQWREDPSGRRRPVIEVAPVDNLQVAIRGAGPIREARSCWSGRTLDVREAADGVVVVRLPRLEEGDVLLLR